jgi:hypothetical protein
MGKYHYQNLDPISFNFGILSFFFSLIPICLMVGNNQ